MKASVTLPEARFGWRYFSYLGLIALYAGIMIFINLCCLFFSLVLSREKRAPVIRRIVIQCTRLFRGTSECIGAAHLQIEGLEEIPKSPCILVANHTGLLDALYFLSILPDVVIVFKQGLGRSVFYNRLMSELGFIGNEQGTGLIRQACQALSDGKRILIFPEGTRTESVPINSLKGGFSVIARRANLPIQTVLIENPSWALGKGGGLFRVYALPFHYHFRVGKSFDPGKAKSSHELTAQVESYFREALHNSKEAPWRVSSPKKSQ